MAQASHCREPGSEYGVHQWWMSLQYEQQQLQAGRRLKVFLYASEQAVTPGQVPLHPLPQP